MEEITQQVAIDIDSSPTMEDLLGETIEDFWLPDGLALVKNKLRSLQGAPRAGDHTTIFRVPAWIKEGNKELYEPKMVSIGPYHRDNWKLHVMEEEKWYSLQDFLSRNQSVGIEVYFKELKQLESAARECYSKDVEQIKSDDFVKMLLLDSCFILEFYLKAVPGQFDARWDTNTIISDLYLLENQIPLFVVHKLFVINGGCSEANCSCQGTCPLLELLLKFPPFNYNSKLPFSLLTNQSNIHHFLDLFYKTNLPNHVKKETDMVFQNVSFCGVRQQGSTKADIWISTMPSATELRRAGVTFRMKWNALDAFDITFEEGMMKMPFLRLTSDTKIILVNMIAFEQSQPVSFDRVFTSYIALMDSLINTEKDIAVLERSGVLKNMLRSEKEAASFFNELGTYIFLDYDDHYYSDLFRELQMFSNSTWHKYRARLFQDFSTNPWTLISVLTGAIALILTFIQTYYSAKY